MLVDVIVVAYNSAATLRDCLRPLVGAPDLEVTVVDNASPDDSARIAEELGVRVVRAPGNGGFAAGCNLGAEAGGAPWILLLNPDAVIEPEGVRALVESGVRHDAAVVGPTIRCPDGRLAWSQRRFARVRSTWSQALFLHRIAPRVNWTDELMRDPKLYESPRAVEWLSGACLLVRRDVYEVLGGIDERFFLYCEDMDLCRRAWAAGHRVQFEPAAEARHVGGASAPAGATLPILARSRVRYARYHFQPLAVPFEAAGIALTFATHFLSARSPRLRRAHVAALRAAVQELRAPTEGLASR